MRGDFRAAARRGWAVLPRNSAVFGLGEGAAWRFSARRTVPGGRGEKIFKNLLERGGKPKNWRFQRDEDCQNPKKAVLLLPTPTRTFTCILEEYVAELSPLHQYPASYHHDS